MTDTGGFGTAEAVQAENAALFGAPGAGGADNHAAFVRAQGVLPGGVSSPVRAYGSVGGDPRFLASARGPYVTDVAGREYVDLVCSWGPALLGHAHPDVVAAVQEAAARGLSFGAPTLGEVELGEEIRRRVPAAEHVRLVSTGTEATMTAIRLARGVTGRDVVVKFAGCYHGHVDALLAEAGSGVATLALPGSAGVTEATAAETLVLPYNDLAAVEAAFAERGSEIAAVITEASPANMGVVPPAEGFNEGLRRITAAHGALLVLDEVLTGFRVGPSGWWGLENAVLRSQGADGWTPDLFTFGKVVGGGMPVAAVGGPASVMDQLAPLGPVYQAGTLSGTRRGRGGPGDAAARRRRGVRARRRGRGRAVVGGRLRARRGGRAAPRAARGLALLRDVRRARRDRGRARLRAGPGAGDVPVPRVLPRDARRGREPAAVGVRGVVRLGRPDDAAVARILDAFPAAARAAAEARPA